MTDQSEKSNAARLSPDDRAALLTKAASEFHANRIDLAEPLYLQILASNPDDVRALVGAALCGSALRRDAKGALKRLDRALELAPDDSHIHQSRAATLNTMGDFDGAVAAARKAIALDPLNAFAYVNLTDSTKITAGDPLFDQAKRALQSGKLSDADTNVLHFAIGKAYQDCGAFDDAFRHFNAGNDLKPRLKDMDATVQVSERLKALFTPAFFTAHPPVAKVVPRPIFIVGMPRSGTTLLERMLAAHPEVSTAGERPEMNQLSADFYAAAQSGNAHLPPEQAIQTAMTRDNLATIARAYATNVLKNADARSQNIIDKMPTNFWNLGLIGAIFADAPILHMQRHPLDTGLSNYIANFRTGLEYSNRLDTLGAYYRLYVEMMTHWHRVMPGRVLNVNYETLVSDPEGQARRILDYCGLDWCDACVHPEKTGGVIATASRWQARQKINTTSIQKWRRYEKHLDPLIAALGGWQWIEAFEEARFDADER